MQPKYVELKSPDNVWEIMSSDRVHLDDIVISDIPVTLPLFGVA